MGRGLLGRLGQLWELRPLWLVPLAVLGVLPLLILVPTQEGRCAYVLLVMAALWLTETIPIAATALLPVFLFPMVGVQPAKDVAPNYITDTSLLFFGGLVVAVAVEEWNLHRRIALAVLSLVGGNPMWLMLGLMLPTWFLSMWISNTATTSMMVPIVNAVLQQLRGANRLPVRRQDAQDGASHNKGETVAIVDGVAMETAGSKHVETVVCMELTVTPDPPRHDVTKGAPCLEEGADNSGEEGADNSGQAGAGGDSPEFQRLCKGMSLCIAYAANIGGIATLIGTGPNLVLKGQTDVFYAKYGLESGVTFASWMVLALPLSALTLVMAWLWLVILFVRGGCCQVDKVKARVIKASFRHELRRMGPISMAEVELLVVFAVLVVLWLSRDPRFAPGWGGLFRDAYVSDASAALLFSVLLFILPATPPPALCFRRPGASPSEPAFTPLLTWDMVHRKLPWGVIVLLGGGFALADACKVSGLSSWVGRSLASLQGMEPWVLNLILCCIVAVATEFTSNTATASLILPILAELAIQIGFNPLYLMASGAIATSFAFVMPVATPPNAIVFSTGLLRIPDMAMAGLLMNVLAVLSLTLAVNTWGDAFFDFRHLNPAFLNATANA